MGKAGLLFEVKIFCMRGKGRRRRVGGDGGILKMSDILMGKLLEEFNTPPMLEEELFWRQPIPCFYSYTNHCFHAVSLSVRKSTFLPFLLSSSSPRYSVGQLDGEHHKNCR